MTPQKLPTSRREKEAEVEQALLREDEKKKEKEGMARVGAERILMDGV
jgi:hypothetical protein